MILDLDTAGRNLHAELTAGFADADYQLEAEDQAVVDGAVADLDECAAALTSATEGERQ